MNESRLLGAVCACLAILSFGKAQAAVLTFDDLTPTTSINVIPNGYGGLDWNLMPYVNAPIAAPLSGYNNGIVSGDYVAFSENNTLHTITSSSTFDFNGAYLTGAWRDGLNINIKGYDGVTLLYDTTVLANSDAPTWYLLDYIGVDKLEFSSFGGVDNPAYSGTGTQFAMDNFTFNSTVPIPASVWLFGSGLLGLIGVSRKKST